jgi:hypothetical protein
MINYFVGSVCFLVVLFISRAGKETILIVRILELLGVDFGLFATTSLSFTKEGERKAGHKMFKLTQWLLQKVPPGRDLYQTVW